MIFRQLGLDTIDLSFENNNFKYKLIFFDISGTDRYRINSIKRARNSNMVIYFFDLSREYNEISIDFINEIREGAGIKKFIL